nr:hypothetical protein [Tanacetum cinerariifolium]
MLELLEDFRQKELYYMRNDVDDLNSKLLSINLKSQHLDKEKQEVKNIVEQPTKHRTRSLQNFRVILKMSSISNTSQISSIFAIASDLPTKKPEYSLSMGDEHLSTILETGSDEVIKSSVENLVPIPSESEVTSDNENTLIDSSAKFDYLLEEFIGGLSHIDPIPPGNEEADFNLEEEIRLVENLLYDNSSPRPPKELNAKIANTILESLSLHLHLCNTPKLARIGILGSERATSWINNARYILNDKKSFKN